MHRIELSTRRNPDLQRHARLHVSEIDKTPHQVAAELKKEVVQRVTEAAKRPLSDREKERSKEPA